MNHAAFLTEVQTKAMVNALDLLFDSAADFLDEKAIAAVLMQSGNPPSAADLAAMDDALGFDAGTLEALAKAARREDDVDDLIEAPMASFFLAMAALAAREVGYTLNPNDRAAKAGAESAKVSARQAFLTITSTAVRETAARMFDASGTIASRVRQIVRVVGLTPGQAQSLDTVREALFGYLTAITPLPAQIVGNRVIRSPVRPAVDPSSILARYAAKLSAPQRAMLAKRMTADLTDDQVERTLSRHASAMRQMRIRASTGFQLHLAAEEAKRVAWQLAQRAGILPADQHRFWETAGDERVRHAHAEVPGLNPDGVPLDQPFQTPLGQFMTPPLEINCRCRAVLRRAA